MSEMKSERTASAAAAAEPKKARFREINADYAMTEKDFANDANGAHGPGNTPSPYTKQAWDRVFARLDSLSETQMRERLDPASRR